MVAFQPRSRLRQRGIRVRGEPATGELVAGGPVVDEGEEALDLADELIEVALLGDDERVQLILLEGAVRQRRQKLPRIFPPASPFANFRSSGVRTPTMVAASMFGMSFAWNARYPSSAWEARNAPTSSRIVTAPLSPPYRPASSQTSWIPPTAEEKDRQPSLPARPPIPCVEARAQQRGSYHSSIIAEPSLYFGNRAFLVRFSIFAISRFQKSTFSK